MLISRRVIWNGEDLGTVQLLSLVGDVGEKQWGIAISHVLVEAFRDRQSAERARLKQIKEIHWMKILILTGLGPHIINLLPED